MGKKITIALISVLAIIGLLLIAFGAVPKVSAPLGAQVQNDQFIFTGGAQIAGGLQIGNTGNTINKIVQGTCTATTTSATLAATSSALFTCSGLNIGTISIPVNDKVLVSLNMNGAGYGGFLAFAPSVQSPGTIQFYIENLTGAATTSYAQATTSVSYLVFN